MNYLVCYFKEAFVFLRDFILSRWDRFDRFLCINLPPRLRFWWSRLWVRKDEFHPSLEMLSVTYPGEMLSLEELNKRMKDLVRRRNIAHKRDMEGDCRT